MDQQATDRERKDLKHSQECEKCAVTNEQNPLVSDLILCSWWIWLLGCFKIHIPKLKCVHQMPVFCRERHITRFYRPNPSSVLYCIKSVLLPTNETMNFWTHFIPMTFLLFHHYNVIMGILDDDVSFIHNTKAHVFTASSFGCLVLLGSSSLAHLFNCISAKGRHVCFCCDYGAISLFSISGAIAYYHFVSPPICHGFGFTGHNLYLVLATFGGLGCHIACCYTRFPHVRCRNVLRTLACVVPFVIVTLPVFVRYFDMSTLPVCDGKFEKTMFSPTFLSPLRETCLQEMPLADKTALPSPNLKCNVQSVSISHERMTSNTCSDSIKLINQFCMLGKDGFRFYFALHVVSFALAMCFKVSRFPESVFPGRFDVIGSSHQLFHIAIASGIIAHSFMVEDAILDSTVLFSNTNHLPEVSIWTSCGLLTLVSLASGAIVFIYSRYLNCEER